MAGRSVSAGKTPLDLGMAALAAASVGFVIFAMPDATFSGLVATSGLPALIPAAEPPLGQTARFAVMVAAAIGTFFLVSLVLRALGQQAPRPKAAAPEPEVEPETEAPPAGRRRSFIAAEQPAPKIRRADAHPDAPARRPLFAGSDLGEPLDEIEVSYGDEGWNDDYDETQEQAPLPEFMTGDPAPIIELADDFDAAPEAEDSAAVPAPEPVADFEPPAFAPEPYQPAEFTPEPCQPEAFAEARPTEEEPVSFDSPHPPEPGFAPEPREQGEATISDLMQRLERGLQRRGETGGEQAPAPESRSLEPVEEPREADMSALKPVDDRLRSALDDLQKMASRGSQA